MILYDKHLDKLRIYETVVDKEKLIEYKKKHLEDIKTAVLHIEEMNVQNILYSSNQICYNALDRKTKAGHNYIELMDSTYILNAYLKGKYDSISPIYVLKDLYYCDEPELNDDYTLLFHGGTRDRYEFTSSTSILLSGYLGEVQPLLSDDVLDLVFLDAERYDFEFNNVIKVRKLKSFNYSDIEFLISKGVVLEDEELEKKLEKSEAVLKLLNRKN